MPELEISLIPAFSDNYIYLLRDPATGTVAVVDPGAAEPVADALTARGWPLHLILVTHHHADHTGGNLALKERYGARILGPAADRNRIPGLDEGVAEGDTVRVGDATARVIETPGHTSGHISFHFAESDALFCGDTLFSLGCGRLFEGTPSTMWQSLLKLRALPNETKVHCGHEYTASNARFALSVDGRNPDLIRRAAEIEELRTRGEPTIPASLGEEKRANPFLRADDPALAAALGMEADPVAVFATLRARKDAF